MEQNTFNSNNIDAGSKIASFRVKQSMPYEFKVNYARIRAWEFYNECGKRDLDCYVSVGGLDSITLFFFLKSIGIDVPAVSVSSLEDVSIQKIHKQIGVISLPPAVRADGTRWNKQKLIQEFGFPVLSKDDCLCSVSRSGAFCGQILCKSRFAVSYGCGISPGSGRSCL